MKMRDLPPLNALLSFSLAARSLSFRETAADLHLTPSAVSHRIKTLERHLGVALFQRHNRALSLTPAGEDYRRTVDAVLAELRDGGARIASRYSRPVLRLSMGSFIAGERILPALPDFQARHPDVELIIETDLRLADLNRDEVDIALRFGGGRWPGTVSHHLLHISALPVCAPALLARVARPGLDPLATLAAMPRLESTPLPEGWSMWARELGLSLPDAPQTLRFDSYQSLLQAAERGMGVAVGLLPLIDPMLAEGRLVAAWPQALPMSFGYYLLHRPGDEERPEVHAFHEWVRALLRPRTGAD